MGRAGVQEFYAKQMLPHRPPDTEFIALSQVVSDDWIVEESVVCFTHTLHMDWRLPGVPPTGRKVEFVLAGIV